MPQRVTEGVRGRSPGGVRGRAPRKELECTRLEEMTAQQRDAVRKVRSKLCTMAVDYKSVRESACANCKSPCRYGEELLHALGVKRQTAAEEKLYHDPVLGQGAQTRRVIKLTNRRMRG